MKRKVRERARARARERASGRGRERGPGQPWQKACVFACAAEGAYSLPSKNSRGGGCKYTGRKSQSIGFPIRFLLIECQDLGNEE